MSVNSPGRPGGSWFRRISWRGRVIENDPCGAESRRISSLRASAPRAVQGRLEQPRLIPRLARQTQSRPSTTRKGKPERLDLSLTVPNRHQVHRAELDFIDPARSVTRYRDPLTPVDSYCEGIGLIAPLVAGLLIEESVAGRNGRQVARLSARNPARSAGTVQPRRAPTSRAHSPSTARYER